MKKHLFLTSLAYMGLGIAITINSTGVKAGLGSFTFILFDILLIFFVIVALTSMQELKDFIKKHDK